MIDKRTVTDVTIRKIGLSKQELNNPGLISRDEKSVTISESRLLVPLGKNKKLAAFRKQSQAVQPIEKKLVQSNGIPSSGLNKKINGLIKAAQEDINDKIDAIMASYPPGKKNKLFTLRYGSPESIKQMTMKTIFTCLGLVKPKRFALIEHLDYFGNDKMKQ